MTYLLLFYEFFKTGLFAVGGGMATLPFLQDIAVRTGWFSLSELMDMIAVSESTPGPIGINMATFAGFKAAGIPGAITATLGLLMPSLIIGIIIAGALRRYGGNRYVKACFYGLRPVSVALICSAGFWVFKSTFYDSFDWRFIVLGVVIFALTRFFKKLHPSLWIAVSAVCGILFGMF